MRIRWGPYAGVGAGIVTVLLARVLRPQSLGSTEAVPSGHHRSENPLRDPPDPRPPTNWKADACKWLQEQTERDEIYDAQDQITIAARAQICAGHASRRYRRENPRRRLADPLLSDNKPKRRGAQPTTAEQFARDVQNVMEYASSFSFEPHALMASTRRLSVYSEACAVGLKYMEPASRAVALDRYQRPLTADFSPNPATVRGGRKMGHFGLENVLTNALADVSEVSWNPLAEITQKTADKKVAFPAAQRYLLGADRFPQSYALASTRAIQALKATGSPENLALLTAVETFRARIPSHLLFRLAFLSGEVFRSGQSPLALAINLFDFGTSNFGGTDVHLGVQDLSHEVRRLALRAADPAAAVISLDLMHDHPIKLNWLLAFSTAIIRGDAISTHALARITSSSTFGYATCTQAWSLFAQNVRRTLWIQKAIGTLQAATAHKSKSKSNTKSWKSRFTDRGSSNLDGWTSKSTANKIKMSDDDILLLALAGVEQAEFAAGRRPHFSLSFRRKALSFAAHRGNPTAQLLLASISSAPKNAPKTSTHGGRRAVQDVPYGDGDEDSAEDRILAEWGVGEGRGDFVDHELSSDEIVNAQYGLLIWNRNRWVRSPSPDSEDNQQYAVIAAQAYYRRALNFFLGRGVEQSLKDALHSVSQIRYLTKSPHPLMKVYTAAFQALYTLNYLSLHFYSMSTLLWGGATFLVLITLGLLHLRTSTSPTVPSRAAFRVLRPTPPP